MTVSHEEPFGDGCRKQLRENHANGPIKTLESF